jgi:hypothetical protein
MKIYLTRLLVALVILVNLQCAVAFLVNPGKFAPGFELSGATGEAAIRGFGVLFLMWNVPYLVALWDPVQNRSALFEAVVMQTIGLIGETYIYKLLPNEHFIARSSIERFVYFDAAGLAGLLLGVYLTRGKKNIYF